MTYKNKYPYYRKSSYTKNYISKSEQEAQAVAGLIVLSLLGIYAFYQKYMKENLETINFYIKITFYIVLVLSIIYISYQIYKYLQFRKKEKERIDNTPLFLRELEEKIKTFTPAQSYREEKLYQVELVGFLKNRYPNSKIEQSINYKRPDICIDKVAIEVKGPTNMSALKTIPDKINGYLRDWEYLFIVLFNIEIHTNPKENMRIYYEKKQEILDNILESKKDKVFFIEINSK